jgi:hypothetical protein
MCSMSDESSCAVTPLLLLLKFPDGTANWLN